MTRSASSSPRLTATVAPSARSSNDSCRSPSPLTPASSSAVRVSKSSSRPSSLLCTRMSCSSESCPSLICVIRA